MMKMWDQEKLLRCWVGQRKHKSDFGETNPILPQAQETKTHLSAMTVYFCSAGLGVFFARPAAFRIPTLPTVPGSGSRPASSTYDFAKQNRHERKELTPEDENVGSRRTPPLLGRAK